MTDTLLQPEIYIVITQTPGVDGAGTTAQLDQIETDLATALARPEITALDDIPDVNAPAPVADQVLMYNGTSWVPGAAGGTIARVHNEANTLLEEDVYALIIRPGLAIITSGGGYVYIGPAWGGTGAQSLVARADHTHAIRADQPIPFSASGTLSSGTRPLTSGSVTGLDPARTYLIKGTLYTHIRGDGAGASFSRPRVTINGVNQDMFEDVRGVAGVLITEPVHHPGVIVTGVSSVAVSATVAFQSGDPSYIGGGVLVIQVQANR